MPIHTGVDFEKQLTVQKVIGEVSFEETMAALNAFYEGNTTLHVMWDLTEGTIARLTGSQIRSISDSVSMMSEKRFKDIPLKRMAAYHLLQSLGIGLGVFFEDFVPFGAGRGPHLSRRKDNDLVSSSFHPEGEQNEEGRS